MLIGQGKARRHIKMPLLAEIAAKHVAAYVDFGFESRRLIDCGRRVSGSRRKFDGMLTFST